MRSAALALSWQAWGRHRLGLALVVAIVLVVAALVRLLPGGSFGRTEGLAGSYLFVFVLGYVVAVFSYGFDVALERGESGYPPWQFTLPVRTWLLAGWPMFQGAATVALLWAIWAQFVLWPAGYEVAVWRTALNAAALTAVLQALVWWPFGLAWARVIVALLLVPVMAIAPLFLSALEVADNWVTTGAILLLVGAFTAGIAGVGRARRGQTPALRWPSLAWSPGAVRPAFASPWRAQLWLERRGLWPFFLTAASAVLLYLPLLLLLDDEPDSQVQLSLNILLLPPLLAPALGLLLGRTNADRHLPLSPFLAARPLSSASLVSAKLWTSIEGTLILWVIVTAGGLLAILDAGRVSEVWQHFFSSRATLSLLALCLLVLTTWRLVVDQLWVGLAGRPWLFKSMMGVYWFGMAGAGMLYGWYVSHEEKHEAIAEVFPWCLAVVVMLKLTAGVWVLHQLDQCKLVTRRTLTLWAIGWLVMTGGLFGFALQAIPEGLIAPTTLALVAILALPLVRLAATPLALEWNRHR